MAHFLWNYHGERGEGKYHLANWQPVSQEKDHGGLGAPDLQLTNMCLLSSWIARYHLSDNSIWRTINDYKYDTHNPTIFCCPNVGSSPFLEGCYVGK